MLKNVPVSDWPEFERKRYLRTANNEVWGVTFKVGSTSLRHMKFEYTELVTGDHVRLLVRHPHDRLVSAWKWFTMYVNSYLPGPLRDAPEDHEIILDSTTPFNLWARTALQHWNPHWVPATSIHPRWREFELIDLAEWNSTHHDKQTRKDNSWEQHYDEATLALANEVYKEDLEMWEVIRDGTNTRTNRVLQGS